MKLKAVNCNHFGGLYMKIKKIIFEELDKTIPLNISKKIDIIVEEYTKEILWKIHKK